MKSTNIEKFKLSEKVRICYLKHGGNFLKVCEELNLEPEFVKKLTDGFKRTQKRDVARLIADDITRYVLLGSEQRKNRLTEIINTLTDEEKQRISNCCYASVRSHSFDGETHYICTLCNKECETKLTSKDKIYALILKYNDQLREEDRLLIDFAEKMGYTDKEPPQITKVTQNIVHLKELKDASELDTEIVKQVNDMKPAEREQLRKRIESTIVNGKE